MTRIQTILTRRDDDVKLLGSKPDEKGESNKVALPDEADIISYCLLGSTPCRPVRILSFLLEHSPLSFEPCLSAEALAQAGAFSLEFILALNDLLT